MPHWTFRAVAEAAAALATLGCLVFYFLATLGLAGFLRDRKARLGRPPLTESELRPVSILKPLKGVDPEIWECFRSHAEQDYPQFEIIFGVSEPDDPAIAAVRELQEKYPAVAIQLVQCGRTLGTNVKVSNLVQMAAVARYGILLVNDSDIRVPKDYLRGVASGLADERVGLVTCLYRGVARPTLGSLFEALGISTDFMPGVLSARFLENGLHFGLGSTLAFRRSDLQAIGGFETLLDYLADDYELGRRIAALGKRVELGTSVVETFLPEYGASEFVRHQLRWSRTIRSARRWGYAGLVFTFGLPWAVVTLLVARGAIWAWALLAMTFAVRSAVAVASAVLVLEDRAFVAQSLLLPVRDLVAPLMWAAGLFGGRIHWRGEEFELSEGRLVRVDRHD